MNREEYMVKGTGIKTKYEYVQERFGEVAYSRFRARTSQTISWPILVGSWYPFARYAEILTAIAEMFHDGRVGALRSVGAYSAEKLLNSTYQAFRAHEDIARLVERLPSLYQRFYNCGQMLVDYKPLRRHCGFQFTGAPIYVDTDMEVAIGFTSRCWAFMGIETVISGLVVSEGRASFDLAWVPNGQSLPSRPASVPLVGARSAGPV